MITFEATKNLSLYSFCVLPKTIIASQVSISLLFLSHFIGVSVKLCLFVLKDNESDLKY